MACGWIEINESYWKVCWKWIFPYPCKKRRRARRWCCDFEWIKETRWVFFARLEGCAGGRRYKWTRGIFLLVGTAWFYRIRRCFKSELQPKGDC